LESEGIDTLWKLISKTPSELLRINGFARVFLTEVVSELDRLGLKLKEEQ
jgi:DNA-directed RNA polymerase alpha subunit